MMCLIFGSPRIHRYSIFDMHPLAHYVTSHHTPASLCPVRGKPCRNKWFQCVPARQLFPEKVNGGEDREEFVVSRYIPPGREYHMNVTRPPGRKYSNCCWYVCACTCFLSIYGRCNKLLVLATVAWCSRAQAQ